MQSAFPILRAELQQPAKPDWPVLQPYFLCPAAVRLLGIDLESRKGRVAVKHCESSLQVYYVDVPLRGSKPERALDEGEIHAVMVQAWRVADEWAEVARYFGDSSVQHKAHSRDDLKAFLLTLEGAPAPGPRSRLSPFAGERLAA